LFLFRYRSLITDLTDYTPVTDSADVTVKVKVITDYTDPADVTVPVQGRDDVAVAEAVPITDYTDYTDYKDDTDSADVAVMVKGHHGLH